MIKYIKTQFLENPELLKEYLECFDFYNIKIRNTYISFGRSSDSSPKSIVIKLVNNDCLFVKDYPKNIVCDIFNYIINEKDINFKEAIVVAKNILGIDEYFYQKQYSKAPFGGFYNKIKSKIKAAIKTYGDEVLNKYSFVGNKRFLKDGISLKAQRFFNIGYCCINQAISIPIWDEVGNIIGVKMRANHEIEDGEQKYWYDIPCQMSQTLYNYFQSYKYLEGTDVVYVVEAEKGCMQAWTLGYKNFVALGSASISAKQVQLLLQLNCKSIVFLHDTGFPLESVLRNINIVKGYSRMKEINVGYWNYFNKNYKDKMSATDSGKDFLEQVLKNEIVFINDKED